MKKISISKIIIYFLLAVGGLVMVFPFFWMAVSSLKTWIECVQMPPTWWPENPTLENYIYAFKTAPFLTYFKNSIIVTVVCTGLTMLNTILCAFTFSRLKFPGRDIIFSIMVSLMMIPYEMLMITNYTTIVHMGLYDTLIALIIPFTSSIFYTYILRNFFLSIPDSLYYSAKVDGASDWTYLWNVMVPIAKPSLVTIGLLDALTCWNSFLWSILIVGSVNNRTLPFGLFAFTDQAGIRYERLMAGSSIVVLPVIILFLFCRKQIVTGVSKGGLKG